MKNPNRETFLLLIAECEPLGVPSYLKKKYHIDRSMDVSSWCDSLYQSEHVTREEVTDEEKDITGVSANSKWNYALTPRGRTLLETAHAEDTLCSLDDIKEWRGSGAKHTSRKVPKSATKRGAAMLKIMESRFKQHDKNVAFLQSFVENADQILENSEGAQA